MASSHLRTGRPGTGGPDHGLRRTWTGQAMCGPAATIAVLHDALDQGLLTRADIDAAVRQDLALRRRLGEFDPYGADGAADARPAREAAAGPVVLLRNAGVLPLRDPKKVAVLGPLADTAGDDWDGGAMPCRVTPRQGIAARVGDVAFSEGVDRIALRQAGTGRYLTGGAGPAGAPVAANGATADVSAQFDVFDWGDGVVTLRSAANGRTVGYNWSGFANDRARPGGRSVQQRLKFERRADGTTVIRYAGFVAADDRAPSGRTPYLVVRADGTLDLGAATAEEATPFTREVISSGVDTAVAAATGADAAVVVVGSMPFADGRGDHDRAGLDLAEGQAALVRAVQAANPNTVVVVEHGHPPALNVPALLWTGHAGQETGHALADVLFGRPATAFRYGALRAGASTVDLRGTVRVAVDVTNAGTRAGDEVVELYTRQHASRVEPPARRLRGFQRVHLRPGERRRVLFTLAASDLRCWDATRDRWVVEDATHDLLLGASPADIRATGQLRVRGETFT